MRNECARCGYGYETEGIVGTHPAGAEDGVQPSGSELSASAPSS